MPAQVRPTSLSFLRMTQMRASFSNSLRHVRSLAGALLTIAVFSFCGGDTTAPPPVPARYLVTFSPTSLVAGALTPVTAQLVDAAGNKIAEEGRPVKWTTDSAGGTFTNPNSYTSATGAVATTFRSPTLAGVSFHVTVTDKDGITGTSASFQTTVGPAATYVVTPSNKTPVVGSTITLTAQLADANRNAIASGGRLVKWRKSVLSGAFSSATSITDGNGLATVSFTFGTTANITYLLIADDDSVAGSSSGVTTIALPVSQYLLSFSEPDPPAGAGVTVFAQAADVYSNPVKSRNIAVTWAASGGAASFSAPATLTDVNGVASAVFTPGGVGGTAYVVTASDASGAIGRSAAMTTQPQVSLASFARATQSASACGLSPDGTAWCWGANASGQLGDGTRAERFVAGRVGGGLKFISLSSGPDFSCAVAVGGTAYCWGGNFSGQLGDNTLNSHLLPAPVVSGVSFKSISAGAAHACAVAVNGEIYCWGNNSGGQLGNGSLTSSKIPVKVSPVAAFATVTAGGSHTCAVATTGTGYCWGANFLGQIGDNSVDSRSTPTPIAGTAPFSSLSAGSNYTCGIRNGAVSCWGANFYGVLGTGTLTPARVPTEVAIPGGASVIQVTAGTTHSCALTLGGEAYCWGVNYRGELGTGTLSPSKLPVAVAGGLQFSSITATGFIFSSGSYYYEEIYAHTCGVTTAGVAYCWGSNQKGQLGYGHTITSSPAPVRVAGQQ